MDRGYENDWREFEINCPRCELWHGLFTNLSVGNIIAILKLLFIEILFKKDHLESKHRDIKCDKCEQLFIFPQQLLKHQENECQFRQISCPLEYLGCSVSICIFN